MTIEFMYRMLQAKVVAFDWDPLVNPSILASRHRVLNFDSHPTTSRGCDERATCCVLRPYACADLKLLTMRSPWMLPDLEVSALKCARH